MRRVLASLLVLLMIAALAARGVAAPLAHLHPDGPTPPAPMSASHHEHADCDGAGMSDAVADEDGGSAHAHAGHAHDAPAPSEHGEVCDDSGACCGVLAPSEASEGTFGLDALPEPSRTAAGAGVKLTDRDRPPNPPIA